MSTAPELCIVMPAYNEEGCIQPVAKGWVEALKTLGVANPRLVVVNDGSKDRTGTLLDEVAKTEPILTVVHQQNAGHGRALRHAYEKAVSLGAVWVFHVDSDDQFDPADLEKLWSLRSRSNFISGFRQDRHDGLHRLVITRIMRTMNLLLFGAWLKDANVPFRLIEGRYLKLLLEAVPATVFAPNIFLSVLAKRDGQDLMFIPVGHRERETGKVSIVRWRLIKACLRCVRELADFRMKLGGTLRRLKQQRQALGLSGR